MTTPTKPPKHPEDITPELVSDLQAALGEDLLGVCLYGSAAQGRYVQGSSDINLLLLVAQGARVRDLLPFCMKWAPARVGAPLALTPSFMAGSLDVFPIEFLVMAAGRRRLWGRDPLEGLEIRPPMLRLQLERELRAKQVAITTRLLRSGGRAEALLQLATEAVPAFTALFQACLQLETGGFPLDPGQVMAKMQGQGVEVSAFAELDRLRRSQSRADGGRLVERWEAALEQLSKLISRVDAWQAQEGSQE